MPSSARYPRKYITEYETHAMVDNRDPMSFAKYLVARGTVASREMITQLLGRLISKEWSPPYTKKMHGCIMLLMRAADMAQMVQVIDFAIAACLHVIH
jgi:hypothetical protein